MDSRPERPHPFLVAAVVFAALFIALAAGQGMAQWVGWSPETGGLIGLTIFAIPTLYYIFAEK